MSLPIIVPPVGPKNARIVLIGEAPGRVEMLQREPFVGPSGEKITQLLHQAGISRRDCYVTNLFKTEVRKDRGKNKYYIGKDLVYDTRRGFTALGMEWVNNLLEELAPLEANVFVPLGKPAMEALTAESAIMKFRGSILPSPREQLFNRKVIPTVHPSAALQQYLLSYMIIFDLRRAREQSEFPEIRRPEREILTAPNFEETCRFLDQVLEEWTEVAIDIEMLNHEISVFGLGNDRVVMAIPFVKNGQYWTLEQEIVIWRKIAAIISSSEHTLIGQNITFDLWVLGRNMHIYHGGRLEDCMIAQWRLYTDFPKGLDFIASIHTEEPYYKDDGKQWFKHGGDFETLWQYNGKDVYTTFEAWKKLERELHENEGYYAAYRDRMALYDAILHLQWYGIRADRLELDKARDELQELEAELQERLNEEVGHELNVQSPTQCQQYFYIELGIKPRVNRKTGNITTDDKAMAALARGTKTRKPVYAAKLVQELRRVKKLRGTYFDLKWDADNRLRSSFNVAGTKSGRLSSSATIFGTGTNNQNLHPGFKKFLKADPGYFMFEVDKKQIEWVITAYLSHDANMITAHREGLDAHTHTAHLAFHVPKELIVAESKAVGHETDPDKIAEIRRTQVPEILAYPVPSSMSVRQAGKKSNHGLNYNMREDTFATVNEVALTDAKLVVAAYHAAYPGIRNTFHRYVEQELRKNRTLHNLFGHPRRFLDRWDIYLLNEAFSHIPQSTAVEVVNRGMIEIYDQWTKGHPVLQHVILLSQVHDSIVGQFPLDKLDLFPEAVRLMCEALTPELEFQGWKFKVGNDLKVGYNWGSYHPDTNQTGMVEIDIDNSDYSISSEQLNEAL